LSELTQLQSDTEDHVKALETGLEKFLDATPDADVQIKEEVEELEHIDQILKTAEFGTREIYESPDHRAVAEENLAASKSVTKYRRSPMRVSTDEMPIVPPPAVEIVESEPPSLTS
jgi:hypothetical protein